MLSAVSDTFQRYTRRVPARALNEWLRRVVALHPSPAVSLGRGATGLVRPRVKHILQVRGGPRAPTSNARLHACAV